MSDARAEIAAIVRQHLDEIVDKTMAEFSDRIAAVAGAGDEARAGVREATKRTIAAFVGVYAEDEPSKRALLEEARRLTIERAGEGFDRDDILAMIRIARDTVFASARALVRSRFGFDGANEADVTRALEAFLDELSRTERFVPREDAVHHLLLMAEAEGPDLA